MDENWIEISRQRLDASQAELKHFLRHELVGTGFDEHGNRMHPLFDFAEAGISVDKWTPEAESRWQKIKASREVGTFYIKSFWEENKWIHIGAWFDGGGPFAYREFYSGHVELTRTYPTKEKPTDVVIVCGWPARRPYWEWVAKRLRGQFRERRKGGPRGQPLAKQIKIVTGWREAVGPTERRAYADKVGYTERRLQQIENELEQTGHIPIRKR